jgi:hypothetical protein
LHNFPERESFPSVDKIAIAARVATLLANGGYLQIRE